MGLDAIGEYDEDEITILKARRLYRNLRDDLIGAGNPAKGDIEQGFFPMTVQTSSSSYAGD